MANFRGVMQGGRGSVSRLGHKSSGLDASVDGWHSGVSVTAEHKNGIDRFHIRATYGSGGGGSSVCLGYVQLTDDGVVFFPANGIRQALPEWV